MNICVLFEYYLTVEKYIVKVRINHYSKEKQIIANLILLIINKKYYLEKGNIYFYFDIKHKIYILNLWHIIFTYVLYVIF